MHTLSSETTVNQDFYQPLDSLVESSLHRFPCRECSDSNWLHLGVRRALESAPSGRAFLQERPPGTGYVPGNPNSIASLASALCP